MRLLSRLLMRNIPLDRIAAQLGVSISTVEKDRAELKHRLRAQSRELDINLIIGTQQELYDEIGGMSLQMASDANTPQAMKLAAMRTALAANADRTRFLSSAGVMDVLRYRQSENGENVSDISILMRRTSEMLESLTAPDAPPPTPTRHTRRSAGFPAFTMDDGGDAQSEDL